MQRRIFWLIVVMISLVNIGNVCASTIYVDLNALGSNTGTSWTDAYTSLHTAMNTAVAGDEIWVAQGIYYATTYFELRTGIEVYGGFEGAETLLTERDWEDNKTILSGDIGQDDVNTDGNYIAETWEDIVGTNADHIVLADMGVDSTAVMDGFIITAGWATTGYGGGGVLNWSSSPSYYNMEIWGNYGPTYGGGMLNVSSSVHVENVLFEGNCVTESYGGGMNNLYAASPVIIHCVFNNNKAHMGGGYACDHGSPYFEDVTFSNNFTSGAGYGGGVYFHDHTDATLIDVTFIGNQSYMGGGIYSFRDGSITMTEVCFIQNTVLNSEISNQGGGLAVNSNINVYAENVSFIGNTAADCGGGAYINSTSTFDLNNGLFLGNHAETNVGGGLVAQYTSTVTLTNTTFNGNRSVISGSGTPRGGAFGAFYGESEITANNCILWGNWPNEVYAFPTGNVININYSDVQQDSSVYAGTGNINCDPQFIDPVDPLEAPSISGDLRINGLSPCVNSGENSYNTEDYDIRGQLRIQNTTIDMGAYEWTDGVDPIFQVLYVDLLATGGNNGSSWTDAYTSLQSALDVAVSGNQIWVAKGTYNPSSAYDLTNTSRYYHFRLIEGVEIYGGFDGTETSVLQRTDYGVGGANETILRGDLSGNDNFDVTNGGYQTTTGDDNCYHVFYHPDDWNLTSSAILDGFTISGGNANDATGNPHNRAGGFYAYSSSPTIHNINFKENSAVSVGGAAYIYNSTSNFLKVSFIENVSSSSGGGIYVQEGSPSFDQIECDQNFSANGGAMYSYIANPTISNAIFSNNNSTSDGGAFSTHSSSTEIINTLFFFNTATNNGGAIIFYSSSTQFSTTLNNVTLTENQSGNNGGAIRFASNNAASDLTINNGVIWNNTAINSGHQLSLVSNGSTTLNYSCYGNSANDVEVQNGTINDTNNDIIVDPLFVDAANEDFRLFGNSPAVNTGNDSYNSETYDIRGKERIQTTIDMGAYEWTDGVDPDFPLLYVDVFATGDNDGSSWANAYTSLQSALDAAAAGDQIWVAKGTYNPNSAYDLTNTSRYYHFRLIEGVEIYGGFEGTETSVSQRTDYGVGRANETILSGDLSGNDNFDVTNGGYQTTTGDDNCYHVFYHPDGWNLTSSAILDGFTISGGNANDATGNPHNRAGGFYAYSSSPTIHNINFKENSAADFGGAAYIYNSTSNFSDVSFINNITSSNGGGIYVQEGSPTFDQIECDQNFSVNGGAMYSYIANPTISNAIFLNNNSTSDGGAFSTHSSSVNLTNALFADNVCSQNGGGLELYSSSTEFSSTFNNVTIANNSASGIGGGISFKSSTTSTLILNNSIIYGNTATTNGNEIASNSLEGVTLNYSCYDNSTNDIFLENGTFVTTNNNITSDPLFVDMSEGDFRLFGNSPAVNSGNDGYNSETYDIRGQNRIQTTIDMGAYEWTVGVDPFGIEGIIYVNINADGLDNGTSWSNAYTSLQSALDVAVLGYQIWVAKGTYKPSYDYNMDRGSQDNHIRIKGTNKINHEFLEKNTDNNRKKNSRVNRETRDARYYHFRMIEGVAIYGGFAGTETSISERTNFGIGEINETILSGDLNGDDVVTGLGGTLTLSNNSENCYHVVYNPDPLTSSSVLNGFTVRGGNGDGSDPHNRGSGIFNSAASLSLINITFTANGGVYGGGICNLNSSPIITNCLIYGNKTLNGAGIENSTSSSPTLNNTTIALNAATGYGGAIINYLNCSPVLNNCIVWGNIAANQGNQFYLMEEGTTTLNYSCYSNDTNDVITASSSDIFVATNSNIISDPLFADDLEGDFRLYGNSPAVNTGNNSYNTEDYDVRGQIRVQNTTIDMGAYEWTDGVDPESDSPLPVTLSSFTGSMENGFPTLNWITQSEIENLGWNIYRSEQGNGYENNSIKLNESLIPGMGTTSIPTDYSYVDEIPIQQTGMHYYWLESVSITGELELFDPVSIDLSNSNLLPDAPAKSFVNNNYPNPFNPITTIELGIKEGETGTISIYNVKGQKVLFQKYESGFHTFIWDASKQASGVYFYQFRTSRYFKTNKMLMLK